MNREGIGMLRYLLDEAFSGDAEHSLLANLRNVRPGDWHWKPDGGSRSIRVITYHTGVAKFLYANHLHGDASMTYEGVLRAAPATKDETDMPVVIEWLRMAHRAMCDGLLSIDDSDLLTPKRAHWGETLPTRRLVAAMIEHDLYHAGEINHIRALKQGDDRWPWQPA